MNFIRLSIRNLRIPILHFFVAHLFLVCSYGAIHGIAAKAQTDQAAVDGHSENLAPSADILSPDTNLETIAVPAAALANSVSFAFDNANTSSDNFCLDSWHPGTRYDVRINGVFKNTGTSEGSSIFEVHLRDCNLGYVGQHFMLRAVMPGRMAFRIMPVTNLSYCLDDQTSARPIVALAPCADVESQIWTIPGPQTASHFQIQGSSGCLNPVSDRPAAALITDDCQSAGAQAIFYYNTSENARPNRWGQDPISPIRLGQTVSSGFLLPKGFEGMNDQSLGFEAGSSTEPVYRAAESIALGLRQYNLFWPNFETEAAAYPSQLKPFQCPPNTERVPANEAERLAKGFHRYRCISIGNQRAVDAQLTADEAAGMQSVVVLWSAPIAYINPACGSIPLGGAQEDACVPRDDAMDDWEDFVTYLASRYNGTGLGKIVHYIVWNENNSGEWFNYSPTVPWTGPLTSNQITIWGEKFFDMMLRARDAVQRNSRGAMIDVSLDGQWTWTDPANSETASNAAVHMGGMTLLDEIWKHEAIRKTHGLDFVSFGIAIHPYGDVGVPPSGGWLQFNDLQTVVDYENTKLHEFGIDGNPSEYPQDYLIASEQQPFNTNDSDLTYRASRLCMAHKMALDTGHIIGIDHIYFYQEDYAGVSYMVPNSVNPDLTNLLSVPTGRAYSAMVPDVWGQTDNNYCCITTSIGCATHYDDRVVGQITSAQIVGIGSSAIWQIRGEACIVNDPNPVSLTLYVGGPATFWGLVYATPTFTPTNSSTCRGRGKMYRFQYSLSPLTIATFTRNQINVQGINPPNLPIYVYATAPSTAQVMLTGSGMVARQSGSMMP